MPSSFADRKCTACLGGGHPLLPAEISGYHDMLGGNWQVVNGHHLEKAFPLKNFREALNFTVAVGELSEQQGHHPDIHLSWGCVRIEVCLLSFKKDTGKTIRVLHWEGSGWS
ncbi:4a-hydroxytetrahydrobiopterin dehydratase [Planctomycetota bacterium]